MQQWALVSANSLMRVWGVSGFSVSDEIDLVIKNTICNLGFFGIKTTGALEEEDSSITLNAAFD